MSKNKNTKATTIDQLPQAQSRLIDPDTLEDPQSRVEYFLHFIDGTGRVAFADLPKPQSRVEWLLYYLCEQIHLGNIGGGGGGAGVTDVTYDAPNKELVVITNGIESRLNLSNLSDVTDVQYDANTHKITVDRNGNILEIDLSKLNTKINNVAPVDGNITLALNQAGDDISLTVGGQDAGTVSLNGYVKTVNGQIPNPQGNVTVDAEHINYNNATSNLNATDVQGAIDELNGKFVSNVRYDATDRSLHQTINGQEQEIVTGLVTQWGDLEHITEYKITNIFNKNLIIDGQCYYANGTLATNNPNWCRYNIPCEANDVISVAKKLHDSEVFTYLSSDGSRIGSDGIKAKDVNGWKHYVVTVPDNADIKMVSINIYKPNNPLDDNTVMIYKGEEEPTTEYYPFANGYNVIIDGSKVALTFDPTGSSLTSSTTHDAIKELARKVANAGGGTVTSVNNETPVNGNVTVNAGHINYNDAQIGLGGITVQDAIKLLNDKIGTSTAGVSDVIYDNNKTLTITKNGQQNQIDLTPLVGIKKINNQAGNDGEVSLSINNATDRIEFKVENEIFATITYMTDNQVQEIKDLFVY